MRALVTGAAGFIGSHLCERLVAEGHDVRGLDCFTDYYRRALKDLNAADVGAAGVDIMNLDLALDPLEDALGGVELVYHLAAQPGINAHTPFSDYERNNVLATHRLLEAAADRPGGPPELLVNVSSSSVYGAFATDPEEAAPKPTSHYGVTKLAGEQLAMAAHRSGRLPACSLRLFSVYGPRERPEKLYTRLIRCILEDREFPLYRGSGEHRRSFTFIGDIIDPMARLAHMKESAAGEIFNIGTDGEFTTARGIEIVEGILGKEAVKVDHPPRPGDQTTTRACIDKARRVLGYDPVTPPEEGLRAQVEWYRERVFGKVDPGDL